MDSTYHQSVLLKETLEYLKVEPDCWYIDGTLGDGGHSLEILRLGGKVLGFDLDPEAIRRVEERFQVAGIGQDCYQLVNSNFKSLDPRLTEGKIIKGCVLDLGVSSMQLDTKERGFSFLKEGPLDMRMDPTLSVAAVDLLNGLHKGELYELFQKYGEERNARRIAEAVVRARPLRTTTEFANLVERVVPRYGKIHPATQVFQALRIAVNDELNSIREALPLIFEALAPQSRLVVISFHSLEDKIVKDYFRDWEYNGRGQSITPKPLVSSDDEVRQNIRSRSAKLRCFEKGASI